VCECPNKGTAVDDISGEKDNKARGVYHGVVFTSGTYVDELNGWDGASDAFSINSLKLRSKLERRA
jgi:hypothetical protein